MKRNAIIRIIIWSVVLVVLTSILFGVLFGVRRSVTHTAEATLAEVVEATSPPRISDYKTVLEATDIYTSPSTDATMVGVLNPGVPVGIGRREIVSGTDWVYIVSPMTGWVQEKYLAAGITNSSEPEDLNEIAFATEALNIRSAPSTMSAAIGMVEAGEEITVGRRELINGQNWAFITAPQEGWVAADYLSASAEPVTESTLATTGTEPTWAAAEPAGASFPIPDNASTFDPAEVKDIEIEWVAGSITIQPQNTDKIIVCEDGETDEAYATVLRNRNGKLAIQFCEDNKISFNFGITINTKLSKDLTIYVPLDWVCNSLEIVAASASVEVSDLTIREVEFDGASGACEFYNCDVSQLDLDTASGDVRFTGSLNTLDCDAASANVYAELTNIPSRIDMDSASGDLELYLPADAGFTVSMDGLSTDFSSDFETTMRNGNYVCGDGSCRITMDGMSGDMFIRKAS